MDNIESSILRNMTLAKVRMFERLAMLNPSLCADLRGVRLPWYTIKNSSDDDELVMGGDTLMSDNGDTTDIFVYDEIGGSMGISANQFIEDLQDVITPNINLRINSPGGNVFDAIAIHNALRLHPANVTTIVDSLAASAASILFMAGDIAMVMPGSQIMIHDASITDSGNPAELRELADFLDKQSDNIASLYAMKSGTVPGVWRNRMKAETWLTADEAVRLGIADKMWTPPQVNPKNVPPDKLPVLPPDEDQEDTPPDKGTKSEEDKCGSGTKPKAEDSLLDSLMQRQHRLTNRGYRYMGRDKAPDPDTDNPQDSISSIFSSMFGGN